MDFIVPSAELGGNSRRAVKGREREREREREGLEKVSARESHREK